MKITPELLKEIGFVLGEKKFPYSTMAQADYYHLPKAHFTFEFHPWENSDNWTFQHGQETVVMKEFDLGQILHFVHLNAYNRGEADAQCRARQALGIEQ